MSFFTLIIIIIIINLFNRLLEGSSEQQKKQEQLEQRLKRHRQEVPVDSDEDYSYNSSDIKVEEPISFEDQREQQLEQLASRMNTPVDVEEEIDEVKYDIESSFSSQKTSINSTLKKKTMKRRIDTGLDREGLVDSIIMAEVLGRPRALKPYKNILMKK